MSLLSLIQESASTNGKFVLLITGGMKYKMVIINNAKLKTKGSGKIFKSRFWRALWRHKPAMLGLIVLSIIVFMSIFAPFLTPYNVNEANLKDSYQSPSWKYILGTDRLGRDVFTRLLYAGRVSLLVGVFGTLIALLIGITLGLISGYYGGKIDAVLLKMAEITLCVPQILIVITILMVVKFLVINLVVLLGLFSWVGIYRLTRGKVLALKDREFVQSARSLGVSPFSIMYKHIFPNAVGPVIVNATLLVALLILAEAGLSFLGLGVQPPIPSWGNMLYSAQHLQTIRNMPWLWISPGVMISATVLAINFLGDGLRDALDPYKVN